ncbi:MAG TPA: N-acetylmuramoyl-L-alanine amidase [Candidatus Saccharimonadales bacterium]|nr:N-acetylmuramoyl-L-alanine amidase [Candidatus Saccharimonadales bacterium]
MLFVLLLAVTLFIFNSKVIHAGNRGSNTPFYSKKQTVCIDPGHGGVDPGATSTDGLISERDINLTVGLKVRNLLNTQGYRVFMTRTNNSTSMDNHVRYSYCNSNHATIMVSIHHNYFTDDTVDYSSSLFYKTIDKGLANSIVNSTSTKLDIPNDGIARFDDGVLSESTMPAAVIEGFFITNTEEYNLLTEPGSTRLVDEAKGITNGIVTYLNNPAKANAGVGSNLQTLDRTDD